MSDLCIVRIGMAVDIGDGLVVAVHDFVSGGSTVHGGGKRLIAWEPVLRDVSLYDVPFCRVRLDASPRRAVLS